MTGVQIGLGLSAILAGWIGGGLVNWAADVLPRATQREWSGESEAGTSKPASDGLQSGWRLRHLGFTFRQGRPLASKRHLIVVLTSILLTAVIVTRWGWSVQTGVGWVYMLFLLAVAVIDFEHHRVLNIMLAPAALVVAAISLLPGAPGLPGALLGGSVGFGVFLLLAIAGRGALGMGDVKLAGVIGMMLGYPYVVTALVAGALLGGVAALVLLATRRATRKTAIAYAPYLACGALLTIWLQLSLF
ncbi:MAG: A24 family peptidase [Caldilinea sp.]|nr:A24 family peptidase [Caldilinea sp.]MDW8442115.1 A24 family peptidase [Caldilineaceae bacterium]